MRRLMESIYQTFFGLRIRTIDQHIDDLTVIMHSLARDRESIERDIDSTATQLVKAIEARDWANRYARSPVFFDAELSNVAPRSF